MKEEKEKLMNSDEDRSVIRKALESINTQYLYYIIIGVFSFIILVFMPMVSSSITGDLVLPKGRGAWVVFIMTRIFVSITNVIIFYSFMQQAKLNVRENEYFKKANEILIKTKNKKEKDPLSPKKWERSQYLKKGTTIVFSTFFALFSLSQAIFSYDYASLISYLVVIFMAVVFGIIQMKKAEIYWTTEYYRYAVKVQEENEAAKEEEKPAEEITVPAETKMEENNGTNLQ